MKFQRYLLSGCLAAALLLSSCLEKDKKNESLKSAAAPAEISPQQHSTVVEPSLLPDRFRQTGYMIREEKKSDYSQTAKGAAGLDGLQLKVGSNITTSQPIPLREAMKAIIRTKNMSLSWAPDVDQELLVDIDIRASDNFYEAIDNILRQLDYFHELEGTTLIIKYRETKQYHVAMPFIKQEYNSTTGVKSLDSSAQLGSKENTFDLWENIKKNLDSLMETWVTTVANQGTKATEETAGDKKNVSEQPKGKTEKAEKSSDEQDVAAAPVARQTSSTKSSYTIDKPVGLITVHAPKSLQKKVSDYLATLEQELYRQIVIEAKIVEVQLDDSSSLGVNWHQLLDNLRFTSNLSSAREKKYNRDISDGDSSEFKDAYSSEVENDRKRLREQASGNEASASYSEEEIDTEVTGKKGSTYSNTTDEQSKNASSSSDKLTSSSTDRNDSNKLTTLDTVKTAATIISSSTGISEVFGVGGSLITNFSFPSFIKALQSQGQTSILSNPKISVMNGQPALISVGKNVTYISKVEATVSKENGTSYTITTDKVLSGVGLALSAVVNRKNQEIVMNLVPITSELTEPIEYKAFGLGSVGLPIVNMREMSTTVKIKDGSMLVVGGLISDKEITEGENFVPGTKNIPYLKYLFGYEEKRKIKRELIILLRPRIIN